MHTQRTRRAVIATAVVAVPALVLTACSSGDDSSSIDLTSTAPTGVTLTLWHNSGDSQALLDLYSAYEEESGNTIDLVDLPSDTYPTAVQTKWATGDRPDLLEYIPSSQDMLQLNMAENMVDLSSLDFVTAEGDLADTSGSLDGVTYGAILGPLETFGVFYNKDVLAAAGVDVPTNYSELLDTCDAITAAGSVPVFVGGGSEFPANMIAGFAYMADYNEDDQYGLGVKDGSIKVNDPDGPIVGGFTAVADLQDAGCLNTDSATATSDQAIADVYSGAAAMTILPSDFATNFTAAGDDDAAAVGEKIGFSAISAEKGIASYSPGSYGSYFVPKTGDTEKERAAADFIEWATSDGYQDYVNAAQSVPTLDTATSPDFVGLAADVDTVLSSPDLTLAFNTSIPGFGNFGKLALKVLAGQDTPQQAADEFQTFVDQAIAAQE